MTRSNTTPPVEVDTVVTPPVDPEESVDPVAERLEVMWPGAVD